MFKSAGTSMAITITPEKTAFEGREVNAADLQRRI
jgi:hypothetical protein